MSVKLLDNSAFYGYRVRRTVQGKVYQEYFSLKSNGCRLDGAEQNSIEEQAIARDSELQQLQKEVKQTLKGALSFKDDGSIRGISYLFKQEKSGNHTPIFQLGIASELTNSILCTSVSIAAYGEDEAWQRIINLYCLHKNIADSDSLYAKLLQAKDRTMSKNMTARKVA